jgi:hypothetical protein
MWDWLAGGGVLWLLISQAKISWEALLTKQHDTPVATVDRRAGTYDHEQHVTGMLWYGTHRIWPIPRSLQTSTAGRATDRDLVLLGDDISAHHFLMERKTLGLFVTDDASTNGLAYEVERSQGRALKHRFDDLRDTGDGFLLKPGKTFLVGAEPYRYIALDDAMREHHPALLEILGREDEVRSGNDGGETPSACDVILAANGPGHVLIIGKPGCEAEELARIIHKISKRRGQPPLEVDRVPEDRKSQSALLRHSAQKTALILHLGRHRNCLDPMFVSALFSPGAQLRVIVTARTTKQARRVLGHQYWRPMMHIPLCPMAKRGTAIHRLLDERLAALNSVLRVADLTPHNQKALLDNPWRENLSALREAAVRLDAIARAGFSRGLAADALGVARQTFYNWYGLTMKLTKPLVPPARKDALLAAPATQRRAT